MIQRDLYMKQIRPFIGKPFVKVLTGIRRCGKSSILMMLRDELQSKNGVAPENILYINFENLDFSDLNTAEKLHSYVKARMTGEGRYYILLDEIQEVKRWEKAVNSLLTGANSDLYITGSNSRLLSSELATYIAGRYIEIKINTLSFTEYLLFKEVRTGAKPVNIRKEVRDYIRLGGFPAVHIGDYEEDTAYRIVNDIYSSAILRDTVQRHNIRNIELLERVVKFVFDNIGNTFSAKNVADYFKSQQRKIDLNTVYNYLSALESAYIIRKIPRYDIKGKEILQTNEKYYIGDQSLAYAVMGYKDRLIAGILENIVMLELERRGYRVFVGKLDTKEVDFIAERKNEKVYVQVSYTPAVAQETINREFAPLLAIKDHYPKYVVTMDDFWNDNVEGVKHKHLAEFLLMDAY
ncbi:ATP-binding protein [Dehalobacter restrictus]|uniref:ATPase n=1 Tax=Dehalobacter restrictus (strain DSM 9455 / PER-K23) TaxID=871738 RepID=A0ABM5P2M3_DEHRP|nr:ATP-binding protein [Dehalobacter restrictus]AHF08791.1 ATPase [Dehalobacter restrictus DSM 9455]